MRQTSHRWLIRPLLALLALGVGYAVLSSGAQTPRTPVPPGASTSSRQAAPDSSSNDKVNSLPQDRPGAAPILREGNRLRLSRNVPGDAKPILLDADEIFTWNEENLCVLLLRGQVFIQQNVVQCRCQQAIVWVDVAGY